MYVKFRKPYNYISWPGVTAGPFFVDITAASLGEFELQLCTHCSQSYPHFEVLNKPNLHLLPRWRFLNDEGNEIAKIKIPTTTFYSSEGKIEGVSGTAEFYFIDDMPSAPRPVYLMAELKQTECLSSSGCEIQDIPYEPLDGNTTISYDVIPLWLNGWVPRYIKFTKDGVNDIPTRWSDLPFNWVATVHDTVISNCDATKKDPIVFNYTSRCDYDVFLDKTANFNSSYCPTSSFITNTNVNNNRIGGYTKGTITPTVSSAAAQLSGTMFVSYTANRVYEDLPVYISNPNNNVLVSLKRVPTVLKPYLFHKYDPVELCNFNGNFEELMGTGGYWQYNEFGIPSIDYKNENDVMGLSGFGGVYGIAVARQYACGGDEYIWAADAELDKVYKISADGSILKTIDFNLIDGSLLSSISATSSINIDISSKSLTGTYIVNLSSIPTQTVDECIHFNLSLPASGEWLSKFDGAIIQVIYMNNTFTTIASSVDVAIADKAYNKNFAFEDFSGTKNIQINLITESENEHLIREIDLKNLTMSEIFNFTPPNYYQCPYRGVTPAAVALDSEYNLWVSLFDSNKVYKFTSEGVKISSISLGSDVIPYPDNANEFGSDVLFKPAIVETDIDDNVWVGYNNSLSSALIKYNGSTFAQLCAVTIPSSSTPVDLLVDGADNSLWVSLAYSNIDYGSINHYSSAGVLLSAYQNIYHPSNITIDKQRRIWYTHSGNSVGCISPLSGESYNFIISGNYGPEWYDMFDRTGNQLLEGIACDYNNKLWIIDSRENYGISLNLDLLNKPTSGFVKFKINPDNNYSWYNDTFDGSQYIISVSANKSAQAFCDWTGYRWWQKYIGVNNNIINATISGSSNAFKINKFSLPFEFRKYNDSWDATNQIRDYSLAPHIYANYNLWENFMGSAVGGREYGRQLGRTIYEKIANYSPNHIDVDESEIRQLYSIAQYLDVPIDSYNISYPPYIQRVMNLISINQSNLWGEIVKCNLNITDSKVCPRCGYTHSNLGSEIGSPLSYIVTAGNPIVAHDRFINGQYGWQLLATPLMVSAVSGSGISYNTASVPTQKLYYDNCSTLTSSISNIVSSYPLSSLLVFTNYNINDLTSIDFYQYIDGFPYQPDCDPLAKQHAVASSVINWNDSYNTLSRQNSSISAWNNSIDTLLQYELLKGLQLSAITCSSSYVPYIPKVSNLYGFVKIDNLYYSQVCVASSFTLKAYACPKNISGTNIPLSSFEWYYNGNLLSTTTGVSAAIVDTFTTQVTSEGQHIFWCNITDQQNNKFLAPTVIYAVSCV